MVNTVQIKRRHTGASGAPTSLASGQMAYSDVDDILYYGRGNNGSGVATSIISLARYERARPEDFGAVGDGVTDDTAALAAWIAAIEGDAVSKHKPRKVGLLGPKTYAFTSLTLTKPVTIIGQASVSVLKGLPGSTGISIAPTHFGTNYVTTDGLVAYFRFENFELRGPGEADAGGGNAFELEYPATNAVRSHIDLVNLKVLKWAGSGLIGTTFLGSLNGHHTSFRYMGANGINLTSMVDFNFRQCSFALNGSNGVSLSGCSEVDFHDCVAFSNTGYGLYNFVGATFGEGKIRWNTGQIDRNGIGGYFHDVRSPGFAVAFTGTTFEKNSQSVSQTYDDVRISASTSANSLLIDGAKFAEPRATTGSVSYNINRISGGTSVARVINCLWGEAAEPTVAAYNVDTLDAIESLNSPIINGLIRGDAVNADIYDVTTGKLMKNGSHGLGGKEAKASTNWDTITATGFYYCPTNTGTGTPTASFHWNCIHQEQTEASGRAFQLATNTNGNGTYVRYRTASTPSPVWSSWRRMSFDHLESGSNTAASPALARAGDTDTGVFFPNPNEIGFATGGVQRALLSNTALQLDVPLTGTAVVQSMTDTTAGRVVTPGWMGLGATAVPDVDANATGLATQFARFTPANGPDSDYWNGLHVSRILNAQGAQIAVRDTGASNPSLMAIRHRDSTGSWSAWNVLYGRRNAIGTVSQSGGVPTGALIERGSNANGEYVRFADGTQICRKSFGSTSSSADVTETFAAAFAEAPSVFGMSGPSSGVGTYMSVASRTVSDVTFSTWTHAGARVSTYGYILAVGRWF